MKRGKPSPPVRKTTKARTKPGFLFHVSAVGRRKAGTALEEGACDFQTHVARNCRAGDDPSKIAKDFGWGRLPRNIQARFSPLEAWKAAEEPRWRDNKGVQGLSQTQRGPSDTFSRNVKALSSGGAVNIRARDAKAWMYGKSRQDAATTGRPMFRGYPKRSVGSNARFRGTQKRRRPAALSISGRETQSRGCMGKAGRTGGRDIRNFQRPVLPAVI